MYLEVLIKDELEVKNWVFFERFSGFGVFV